MLNTPIMLLLASARKGNETTYLTLSTDQTVYSAAVCKHTSNASLLHLITFPLVFYWCSNYLTPLLLSFDYAFNASHIFALKHVTELVCC